VRKELEKVAKGSEQVYAAPAQQVVFAVFRQLCLLQSSTASLGKIPNGVILGYLVQAGKRMTRRRHTDEENSISKEAQHDTKGGQWIRREGVDLTAAVASQLVLTTDLC
jgi:hypothetical protein